MKNLLEQELSAIVGSEYVLSKQDLDHYRYSTNPVVKNFDLAVRPENSIQIQSILKIANQHKIPLYPISSGKNWGYGTSSPCTDGCILLDLSRMNAIIEVNAELGYAIIEPGVTQFQLSEYLKNNNSGLILNVTGSSPHCSIVGNFLEKGWGVGPYGDHFEYVCGMEVILANGDILKTGFNHYKDAKAAQVYKWGIGAYLDGLFTQSSNGIVTKMCIWLRPKKEYGESCYLNITHETSMPYVVSQIRKLLLNETIHGGISFIHKDRMEALGTKSIYTPDWTAALYLEGTKQQVALTKKIVRKAVGNHAKIIFFSQTKANILEKIAKFLPDSLKFKINVLTKPPLEAIKLFQGTPTEYFLSIAYLQNKLKKFPEENVDPARDNCGLIWFSPITRMDFSDISELRNIAEPIYCKYSFNLLMGMTTIGQRAFSCTLPLLYDRNDEKEAQRAQACYEELTEACQSRGYISYRSSAESMHHYVKNNDVFWQTIGKIKNAIDPENIISPKRYSI